jgi:very-short-patch-repair endonuclease
MKVDFQKEVYVGLKIVDYYIPSMNLIIELDGSVHYIN